MRKVLKKVYYGKPIYPEQITRGPCDEGYHIPTRQERLDLYNIGINIGAWTIPGQFANMLMLPPSGYFVSVDMVFGGTDTLGVYMTCTPGISGKIYAYGFNYQDGTTVLDTQVYKTNGLVIRPFKNEGSEPIFSSGGGVMDTNRTTLYGDSDTKIGVFYSQSSGLITISEDGINFVTIKDRNLGASSSWTPGSSVLSSDRGNVYQFGNNHGWSSPATDVVTNPYTTDKVDISSYGYRGYDSDLYVSSTFDRATTDSNRLWIPSTEPQFTEIKYIYAGGNLTYCYNVATLSQTFIYTGSDQHYTVPAPGYYTIKCRGAGSNNANGGYAEGTVKLSAGSVLSVMVGGAGNKTDNGTTYGFGLGTTYGGRGGGGLSGVFIGDTTIGANDAARALIIAGGAGGGRTGGGAGGGLEGQPGTGGSYGAPGGGGTQTSHGSGGNAASDQFQGGYGSGIYGFGGGGGRRGGRGSTGDGSGDDDAHAGGGSGYAISTARDVVLTQGGGNTSNQDGKVEISISYYPGSDRTPVINRELFDETDFTGGSVDGTLGKIIRPAYTFGGGNGNYSIGTVDGYPAVIVTQSHGNCQIGLGTTNFNEWFGHSKVKVVIDYFKMGNLPNSYTNQLSWGQQEYFNVTSGGISLGTDIQQLTLAINTKYSLEEIIDTATMETTIKVTNLDTDEVQEITYTKTGFIQETNSSYIINGGGPELFRGIRDNGSNNDGCWFGNMHLYYCD